MQNHLARFALSAAAAALWIAPAASAHGQKPDLYPTDACVAHKLQAAAHYCREAVWAWDRGDPSAETDGRLEHAREKLADAWDRAEAQSLEDGVSCEETTATADEMIDAVDESAAEIAAAIATSEGQRPGRRWSWWWWPWGGDDGPGRSKGNGHGNGPGNGNGSSDEAAERRCESRRNMVAAQACHHLLSVEGFHLYDRARDREREWLTRRQEVVERWIDRSWSGGVAQQCVGGPSDEEAVELITGAVEDIASLALVSPRVPTEWTMITPDEQVEYQGKTLEPICSKGTPWVFFVKRGTVNKTLMYYQGGGACWNYLTCSLGTAKFETGPGDNPANATTGFADLNDPRNPFKDWNAVMVPYCTADVHWGDAVVEHTQGTGPNQRSITINHKGFVNAQVAEKWAREHFVNPDQTFVTGSSAGSYGALVNSLPLQEYVWPSTDFAVVGDGGNGVITQDFLENDLAKWGIEQNLPEWIPGLNVPLTELTAADLYIESANFYPHNRFASYSTAYDGGQGGQVGFYNVMLNPANPIEWVFWWRPSCEWNEEMRALSLDAAAQAANYRYYIGSGSRHTMWGNDKVYTDTTGNVPTVQSWLTAMLDETPDWVNVESDDPGLLLTGDPRPNPYEEPYVDVDGGRVVCE
jgi:hypothetical protein